MKRVPLLLLLFAAPVSAQESWTIPAPVVATVEKARVRHNAQVCQRARLDVGCTQAEVDASVPARLNLTLYPDTATGRRNFALARPFLAAIVAEREVTAEARRADQKARCEALDQAAQDRICAEHGLPNGCEPCS